MFRHMMVVATAAIVIGGSAAAQAQTASSGSTSTQGGSSATGTTAGTTTQGGSTGTTSGSMQSSQGSGSGFGGGQGAWFGSGFVGSTFAQSTDDANVNFGGSVGHLFGQSAGFEFAADFSPNFVLASVPLGQNQVNTYMVNFVGAVPVGLGAGFQPFATAGLGAITLRSDQSQFGAGFPGIDDNQFAFNVGGGVMAFKGNWGVKADVRYFRGVGNNDADNTSGSVNTSGLDNNGNFLLNNVDFWRTNVGLAFRW